MRTNQRLLLATAALGLGLASLPTGAFAQEASAELMGMSRSQLRDEIGRRYTDAVAITQDPGVVAADNTRFLWASQAKAQCGIALGFLKSGHKDPVSIAKCDDAWRRLQAQPPAVMAPPPPQPVNEACSEAIAGIVFFDWDSAVPPESANQTLDAVVANASACRWQHLVITGHTDRSGSDAYNNGLSVRRATAVAGLLGARGIASTALEVSGHGESEPRVPTVDGERNPQNRRVEITAR